MKTRAIIAGGIVALAALPIGATASAAPDHAQTLREICLAHDGISVPRPGWWQARCQGSRPSNGAADGLRAAFMICTMQMDGEFFSAATDEAGTMNWICF